MATLANRNICDRTQNNQVSSPTVLQNWKLCWGKLKSGVTLGLDHLYVLCLLYIFCSLFGLVLILYPDLGYLIGK